MPRKDPPTFEAMQPIYAKMWATMELDPGQRERIAATAGRILSNKARYQKVGEFTGVPWWWIGITHNMEAGGNFAKHLHNGDPLTARTTRVPAGRPTKGNPPFTWEESAVDALQMKHLGEIKDWTVERAAYEWERYNGWGYTLYHPEDKSPYLWSKTNHNDGTGKYVSDGKYDRNAFSEAQCGTMPTLKLLMERDPTIRLGGRTRTSRPATDATAGAAVGTAAGAATKQAGFDTGTAVAVGIFVAAAVIAAIVFMRRKG